MTSRRRLAVAAVWCATSLASLAVTTVPAVAAEGERDVYDFGTAADVGDTGALSLVAPLVGAAATPSGGGYWLAAADGGVFAYGNATFRGSAASLPLAAPVAGIAAPPSGNGYWLVGADGGVFSYAVPFMGSAAGLPLAAPIVGIASTPTGGGYWLVGADGGVFAYGDAVFRGSAALLPLVEPIVGIAPTPSGNGYWLVAADGGVFAYGDAAFLGSAAGLPLTAPVVGIEPTATGNGYWLAAGDGGVFAYGGAPFLGSTANLDFIPGFVALVSSGAGGYWLVADGMSQSLFPGIWPQTTAAEAAADTGHLDPAAVAAEFMDVYAGMTGAVAGSFAPLGPGIGAVGVTPVGGGLVTTVTVRTLTGTGPGRPWTVTAAQSPDILVDVPQPLSAIGPLAVLTGRGRAFEGHINVEVRQDGQVAAGAPLGEGFVTGGGGEILPFAGAVRFTTPTEDAGAVLFFSLGGENGSSVRDATAVRVALPNPPLFPGGLTLQPGGAVVPVSTFNTFVSSVDPAWAEEAVSTAFYFAVGPVDDEFPQRFEITNPAPGVFEVTGWGSADDSVEAGRFLVRVAEQADGTWRVTSATWSQKCWPGRGHQDFSTVPCI
jgi:Immunoglobulin-like domain of bacterial spore germination